MSEYNFFNNLFFPANFDGTIIISLFLILKTNEKGDVSGMT